MADEQYRWLNRETAELLLRGESLEAVDAAARDQAERLAKTLQSLTPEPAGNAELPGESAALAAFRAARADEGRSAVGQQVGGQTSDVGRRPGSRDAGAGHPSAGPDAGLVSLGAPARGVRRSRWGRPTRFGLAAALAAGMVGGVAYAATSGILPTPFGGDEPGPAASVSAATPDRPLISPTPNGVVGAPTPDDSAGGSPESGTPNSAPSDSPTSKSDAKAGRWWRRQAPSTCRDALGGKELSAHRRQALENAAGGSTPDRVRTYCRTVLDAEGIARDGKDKGDGKGRDGNGNSDSGGRGKQNGTGGQGGQGDDEGNHIAPGGTGGTGGVGSGGTVSGGTQTSAMPLLPGRLRTTRPPGTTPTPSPPYSAL